MKQQVLLVYALLLAAAGYSQPRLTVSSTRALIGDHLQLTLEVGLNAGDQWVNQDVVPADTVAPVEVLETSGPEIGQDMLRRRWTIAVFDTGWVRIPP
ncbi:MAG: hypothetical protein R3330_17525, partial [Saprospiraceae bacterium]|nr:hypothetical protein [Saprospiraceae bacterium]